MLLSIIAPLYVEYEPVNGMVWLMPLIEAGLCAQFPINSLLDSVSENVEPVLLSQFASKLKRILWRYAARI